MNLLTVSLSSSLYDNAHLALSPQCRTRVHSTLVHPSSLCTPPRSKHKGKELKCPLHFILPSSHNVNILLFILATVHFSHFMHSQVIRLTSFVYKAIMFSRRRMMLSELIAIFLRISVKKNPRAHALMLK